MQKEDPIFKATRQKAVEQYLSYLEEYPDLSVRDGVRATKEYIEDLKKQISILQESNALKDSYLKKLKEQKANL